MRWGLRRSPGTSLTSTKKELLAALLILACPPDGTSISGCRDGVQSGACNAKCCVKKSRVTPPFCKQRPGAFQDGGPVFGSGKRTQKPARFMFVLLRGAPKMRRQKQVFFLPLFFVPFPSPPCRCFAGESLLEAAGILCLYEICRETNLLLEFGRDQHSIHHEAFARMCESARQTPPHEGEEARCQRCIDLRQHHL